MIRSLLGVGFGGAQRILCMDFNFRILYGLLIRHVVQKLSAACCRSKQS